VIAYSGTTWSYFGGEPIAVETAPNGLRLYFDPHHGEPCRWCQRPVYIAELTGPTEYNAADTTGFTWNPQRRDLPRVQITINVVIGVQHLPCGCTRDPYLKRTP
jgi:hypothetical protein